ncbi:MAG: DNA cytosine methyltransferase [Gammaproteobacteria bacterium]|nr:DNA cytosine methyltransferase [Gammaproteobacteria bacterium]MYF39095.1 DNA cytosine methyltransferase [Gammaproteobacteria bacterium]
MTQSLKFVDLFAGLGGFHHGLSKAGGFKCVFASEIDPQLRDLYEVNHGLKTHGDLTQIGLNTVPKHEVLCAGFPCQPFSLAGQKKGISCPQFGRLIDHVIDIARFRKPEFLFLENVPGLLTVENGSVWKFITSAFTALGYKLTHKVISPLDVAVPQNRKRLFIVGSLKHDVSRVFDWPSPERVPTVSEFLENTPSSFKAIESNKRVQLEKWQHLLLKCQFPEKMPIVSIASPEFGATYPLDFSKITLRELREYRGAYGNNLRECIDWADILGKLPSYCRRQRKVPSWLTQSINFSRNFYKHNKEWLDEWHRDLNKCYNSWQVLEWRGDRYVRLLNQHLLQFRASGIRVIKPHTLPSLIAMTPTQVPIIGSGMRYLTKDEAARFQSLHDLTKIPIDDRDAFKAIGNAVNAKVVEKIASNIWRTTVKTVKGTT